jgi:hypothetical protein
LAAGKKCIIQRQYIGRSEPDATLTTFGLKRVEVILFARYVSPTLITINTLISLLGFRSDASANFTSLFSLDHTFNDVSEN